MKTLLSLAVLFACGICHADDDPRLATLLKKFPAADADKDGKLTVDEAKAFLQKRRGGGGNREQNSTIFVPSDEEMKAAIAGGRALSFPKDDAGSGQRIAMTGHSWVAPGIKTLPPLAKAAGYQQHQQVSHTGGGGTGAANAIWLKEFGKWQSGVAAKPTLIPAIATGKWDVMTWGPFYEDKPEYYYQWVDFCLEHNPETKFLLQDAWPRFDPGYRELDNPVVAAAIGKEHRMMQEAMFGSLHTAFEDKYPGKVRVIPVSAALVDLMQQFAGGEIAHLTCIDEAKSEGEVGFYRDGGHLSRTSGVEHLVGYGYFAMLYQRSPATVDGYVPSNVPPAFDKQMREAIWKAVVASPFSGIKDADGDGIADR